MAASRQTVASGRSCLECRRRKIRCDRSLPCAYCVRTRIECVYPPPKAVAPNRVVDGDLAVRVERMERMFQSLERSVAEIARALHRSPGNSSPLSDHGPPGQRDADAGHEGSSYSVGSGTVRSYV